MSLSCHISLVDTGTLCSKRSNAYDNITFSSVLGLNPVHGNLLKVLEPCASMFKPIEEMYKHSFYT